MGVQKKKCCNCKETLPREKFNGDRSRHDGLQSACKDCRRKNRRKYRYGVTHEEFLAAVEKRKSLCDICKKKKELVLDHCHQTREIRGYLCRRCNGALGNLGDTEEGLMRALEYLRGEEVKETYGALLQSTVFLAAAIEAVCAVLIEKEIITKEEHLEIAEKAKKLTVEIFEVEDESARDG